MGTLILIENLHKRITGPDLHARIGDFADAEFVTIFHNAGRSEDEFSAYAVMTNDEEADALVDWLDDTAYGGRTLSVSHSLRPNKHSCGARSLRSWESFLGRTRSRTTKGWTT